jgi:hypothetical protein
MEITNVIISNSFFDFVLKNKVLSAFLIIIFLTIIIIVGVTFYNFQTTKKGKFCVFVFFSILFTLSLCLFPFYVNFVPEVYDPSWGYDAYNRYGYDKFYSVFDGRTDKYIVEYNIENSKKTMTTQEIIDAIYNQRYFKDRKEKTSKVVIYVKGRENIKLIKQILRMNDTTNFIKENEQKEKEQNENSKFLDETHVIDTKK